MVIVVKSTELDGVTLKDGDVGELLEDTGVNKRIGLRLISPTSINGLHDAKSMILINSAEDEIIRTSNITNIVMEKRPLGVVEVHTRNTIYFLQEEGYRLDNEC